MHLCAVYVLYVHVCTDPFNIHSSSPIRLVYYYHHFTNEGSEHREVSNDQDHISVK